MSNLAPFDERAHFDVWKATLDANLDPHAAYAYDGVPGARSTVGAENEGIKPPIYVLLSLEGRAVAHNRRGSQRGLNAVRMSTRACGRTWREAAWARLRAAEVIDEQMVSVGSVDTTPVIFENEEPIAFDGEGYSGLTRWIYQH